MEPIREHRLRRGTLIPALNSSLIPALNLESRSGAVPNERLRRGIPEWIPRDVCRQILRRHFGTMTEDRRLPRDRAIDEAESQPPPQSPPQSPPGMAEPEAEPKTQSQRSGASQWLNAPSKAHPDNCQPCWFTAKNKGCDRDGCLFCHQPHDTGDVRLNQTRSNTSAKTRQRQARRQADKDFNDAHIRIKPEAKRPVQSWPLSDFQISRPVGAASALPNQTAPSQMGAAEMIS